MNFKSYVFFLIFQIYLKVNITKFQWICGILLCKSASFSSNVNNNSKLYSLIFWIYSYGPHMQLRMKVIFVNNVRIWRTFQCKCEIKFRICSEICVKFWRHLQNYVKFSIPFTAKIPNTQRYVMSRRVSYEFWYMVPKWAEYRSDIDVLKTLLA